MEGPISGRPPDSPAPPRRPLIAPTQERWAAMSREDRDRFLLEVLAAHSDPAEAMSEGRPHKRAKSKALDELGLHFSSIGRRIYLADEMAVVYPGEETFVPDILAVLEVEQPPDDERGAWVVADEGRGLDLAIEVPHHGNRDKDLVRNVEWYARLGIGEYFVFDRLNYKLHAYRLPGPGARQYRDIRPRLGRYESKVLGLDLAIVERQLRFFAGYAELIDSAQLIGRLSGMMDAVEGRATAAESRAAAVEAQAAADLREAVLMLLSARQVEVPEGVREQLAACQDLPTLRRYMRRAATASAAQDLLADTP